MAGHQAEIDRRRRGVELRQILADGVRRAAVRAADGGGDALPGQVLGERIAEHPACAMAVDVDEAGHDRQTARIQPSPGSARVQVAEGRDPVAEDADVGDDRVRAAAIVDVAVLDDDRQQAVVGLLRGGGCDAERQTDEEKQTAPDHRRSSVVRL